MHSKIRATQILTRCCRLNPSDPAKTATMFIPHITPDEDEDYEAKKRTSFQSIMDIIRALGDSEEAIYQRLVVTAVNDIDVDKHSPKKRILRVESESTITDDYIENIKKEIQVKGIELQRIQRCSCLQKNEGNFERAQYYLCP